MHTFNENVNFPAMVSTLIPQIPQGNNLYKLEVDDSSFLAVLPNNKEANLALETLKGVYASLDFDFQWNLLSFVENDMVSCFTFPCEVNGELSMEELKELVSSYKDNTRLIDKTRKRLFGSKSETSTRNLPSWLENRVNLMQLASPFSGIYPTQEINYMCRKVPTETDTLLLTGGQENGSQEGTSSYSSVPCSCSCCAVETNNLTYDELKKRGALDFNRINSRLVTKVFKSTPFSPLPFDEHSTSQSSIAFNQVNSLKPTPFSPLPFDEPSTLQPSIDMSNLTQKDLYVPLKEYMIVYSSDHLKTVVVEKVPLLEEIIRHFLVDISVVRSIKVEKVSLLKSVFHQETFPSVLDVHEKFKNFETLNKRKPVDDSIANLVCSYVRLNYNVSTDKDEAIKASLLVNDIYRNCHLEIEKLTLRNNLLGYLSELGIQKKRFKDGMYYYGLKYIHDTPTTTADIEKSLEELIHIREDQVDELNNFVHVC